jgi:predicted nucleotidyltransferase
MNRKAPHKDKIVEELRHHLSEEKSIIFAYLHGSFLDDKGFNDLDVAIYMDQEASTKSEPVDLEISLSLKIEKFLRFPVDVKILNFAPLSFRYHVTKGNLILSRDEAVREEYICHTWSEYFDFQPVARIYLQEALVV